MIRFCDKEICCVTESGMDWQQMLDYFLDWHMDERIYILDDEGKYIGCLAYNSLFGMSLENSVQTECKMLGGNKSICIIKDYVILDKNIWKNGRKYFRLCGGLLPVLNQEHQLICFAWNEKEANRELRMLDELIECDGAADFEKYIRKLTL